MQQIKFPANFTSAMPIYSIESRLDWIVSPANDSAAYVGQIEQKLAEGGKQYAAHRYDEAIAAYKGAQALIYRLLHPHEWGSVLVSHDDIVLPVGAAIEKQIAARGIELVERIKPELSRPQPPVAPAAPVADGGKALSSVGFVSSKATSKLGRQIDEGVGLLEAGKAAEAVKSLQKLKSAAANDRAASATVALNLSSAQLAAGDPLGASRAADASAASFAQAGDRLGAAQALHNKAVALTRLGNDGAAHETFAEAAHLASPAVDGNGAPAGADGTKFIRAQDASTAAIRRLTGGKAIGVVPLQPPATATWSLQVAAAGKVTALKWVNGKRPTADSLLGVLGKRKAGTKIGDLILRPSGPFDTAAHLSHLYGFVIPQALGDCYRARGDHERAEQYFLDAAKYSLLNEKLEAPALWARLAGNALEWGDRLYRQERLGECRDVYGRVLTAAGKAPAGSPLFSTAGLAKPAAEAKEIIAALGQGGPASANPAIALPILTIWQRWQFLSADLDFWGTPQVPIFTFEYMQQVARGFAEQAIHAEREYVTFQSQAEAETATRRQLEGAAALAAAEADSRSAQYEAARAETAATDQAVDLAKLRVKQAKDARSEYQSAGYWQYVTQSIATAHSAHEDWHGSEIRKLAADIEGGSWEGAPGKLAAAATLLGGQKSYEYQLARLQDHIAEAQGMVGIAEQQARAARAREDAAGAAVAAAAMRKNLAEEAIAAFENEVFTPELWARMAQTMRQISASYREWAIRTAKIMERAYNFETDSEVKVIKSEYPGDGTEGLLGSDDLLRDVESFTWQRIAHTRSKESQLKHVVSLVNDLPFSFYELQRTGTVSFGTMLRDFEQAHPGFYGQRIDAVEVELVGLLPPGGPCGVLRGGGTSRYRTADGDEKVRVHGVDTLALSEYDIRQDGFLYRAAPGVHGLFEGHGLATTWELSLPKRSNDFDFRQLADVRLIVYYSAQFSPQLRDAALAREPLPGELVHVRNFLARYDFPEAWYSFLDDGSLSFTLDAADLPRNETAFTTAQLALTLVGEDGVDVKGVDVEVTPPGRAAAKQKTDAGGSVAAAEGNALAGAMGGPLLGEWEVRVTPPAGSDLLGEDGGLRPGALRNLALVVQYGFSWPE